MSTERNRGRGPALAMVVSTVLILLVAAVFGSYYEEYQALFNAMLSGSMSPGVMFESWYSQGYFGLSYLFARLYALVPQVEWLGWITYASMALAGGILLFLFGIGLEGRLSRLLVIVLQLLLGFLLLSDHVLNLVNARMVFLMCGASMLGMIVLFSEKGSIRKHPWTYAGLLFLFLIGALLRSEAALAVGMLLACFSVVWNGHVVRGLGVALPPLLISLVVVVGIMADLRTSEQFHKQVEPDIEMQYTMRSNVVPLSTMSDARDSLRYEAALQMIWGDPDVISVEFLRSLIASPSYTTWSMGQVQRTTDLLIGYVQCYWHLMLTGLAPVVMLLVRLPMERQWTLSLIVMLYVAGFFIAVAGQTYFVRMTPWSFSPYLSVFIASVILLFLKHVSLHDTRTLWAAGAFLVFGVLAHAAFLSASSQRLKDRRETRQQMYVRTLELTDGGTLLITPASFQHFLSATPPLTPFSFSAFDRLYFFESQIASLLPGYRDYLEKECACDVSHLPNFYLHLLKRGETIYCLTTPERADLIERYLEGIHGLRLAHCPVPGGQMEVLERDGSRTGLMLYTLHPTACPIGP